MSRMPSAVDMQQRRPAPREHAREAADGCLLVGVELAHITERQCVEHVLEELEAGRGGWIVTVNLDILRRAAYEDSARALVKQASARVADGMPVVWASRICGQGLPERVAGSNLIGSVSAAASERGRSVFLLGGDPGTANEAAAVLKRRSPALRVAGTWCPPIGFEDDPLEMGRLIEALVEAQPDIVYVALGFPKQERLIERLRPHLPRAWWIGVGISFSFLCGRVRRAPRWMQRLGLEWAHRLAQEPGRLFRRYVIEDAPFAVHLLLASVRERFSPMRGRKNRGRPSGEGLGR